MIIQHSFTFNSLKVGSFKAGHQIQPADENHGGINNLKGPYDLPEMLEQSLDFPWAIENWAGSRLGIGQLLPFGITRHGFSRHNPSPYFFLVLMVFEVIV